MQRQPQGFARTFGQLPNGSIFSSSYYGGVEYFVKAVISDINKPVCLRLYPGNPVTSYRPSTQWRGAINVKDDDVFFLPTEVYVRLDISSIRANKSHPEAGDISIVGPFTVLNISTDKGDVGIKLLDGTRIDPSPDTPIVSFSEWSLMYRGLHEDTVLFSFPFKPE